ncbi:hypothetical protein GA0061081_11052 [Gilliamella bombicola]|uniref:Lipoprotein n=1 Tax=Gilliamella bombicola TaxID=1798182 RepID=A0A1C4CR55_9GAMM|nr:MULTISPECIES: hypothetical protein [Gilliamella]NUF26820.1 hypothetical protein [Gilliamella sp. ESL0254]SCC21586.1 hypothetical protein GA0061081_11052 [Gilliamella bombicola]
MYKLLKLSTFIICSLLITSCAQDTSTKQADSAKKKQEEYLAKARFYSDVEPKGKQPKARITVVQVGSDDFTASRLSVFDLTNTSKLGYFMAYRFGDETYAPIVTDIHGVQVSDENAKPINQLNIVPDKPFIFNVAVYRYKKQEPGWFHRGYTELVTCKWNNKKIVFIPKKDTDYLLSIGAKPTEDKKKFFCIFKLQEWDKKTKEYKETAVMPLPEK